jgi:Rod binding domain-containing protein
VDAFALDIARAAQSATSPKLSPTAGKNIEAAARDFEAVFIGQMFEQMWSEIKTDGPMGGGSGERVFRSLMIQDIGRQLAAQGGIGLADVVKRELIAMQEEGRRS